VPPQWNLCSRRMREISWLAVDRVASSRRAWPPWSSKWFDNVAELIEKLWMFRSFSAVVLLSDCYMRDGQSVCTGSGRKTWRFLS